VNWANLEKETPGKFSTGASAKRPVTKTVPVTRSAPKTASNTVQDQIFDYLGEMLKKNVLADEKGVKDETQVEFVEDIDLDDL